MERWRRNSLVIFKKCLQKYRMRLHWKNTKMGFLTLDISVSTDTKILKTRFSSHVHWHNWELVPQWLPWIYIPAHKAEAKARCTHFQINWNSQLCFSSKLFMKSQTSKMALCQNGILETFPTPALIKEALCPIKEQRRKTCWWQFVSVNTKQLTFVCKDTGI